MLHNICVCASLLVRAARKYAGRIKVLRREKMVRGLEGGEMGAFFLVSETRPHASLVMKHRHDRCCCCLSGDETKIILDPFRLPAFV